MRTRFLISTALLVATIWVTESPRDALSDVAVESQGNLQFAWAFVANVRPGGDRQLVSVGRQARLSSGDELKSLLVLRKPAFVYLVHRAADQLTLFLPSPPEGFSAAYEVGTEYLVPPAEDWLRLDANVGLEVFYLLVSARRLESLEAMFVRHQGALEAERRGLAAEIVTEIDRLRRTHRNLAAPAEKPVAIGGSLRSDPTLIGFAVEISANDFFSRTFTIEHR